MNKNFLAIFLVIGLSFVLLGCCGATGGSISEKPYSTNLTPRSSPSTSNQSSQSVQPNVVAAPPAQTANIENAEIGKTYIINYANSRYEVTLTEAEFARPTSSYFDQYYLLANFDIKNVGEQSKLISPEIYALDSNDEKYDKTIAIGVSDKYSKTLDFFKKLNPGTKMSGWAAIEVPKNTTNADLYFEYSDYLADKPNYIKWTITKN